MALPSRSLACFGALALASALARAAATPPGKRAAQLVTDQVVEATLLPGGRRVLVEYDRRGPLPASPEERARCPTCPPDWALALVVRDARNPSRVLAMWQAPPPPTSIPYWNPAWGRVWHAGHPAQTLLTVGVQYGAKATYLFAVQWIGGKLHQIGRIAGDNGGMSFSFSRRKSDGALIITRLSGARVDIPTEITQFYVWNGLRFYDGGREFPGFYERLAARAAQVIEGPGDKSAIELVQSCTIALKAYDYAGSPAAGVTLCREALDRLLTGRSVSTQGLMKVNGSYTEDLKRYAQAMRQEIDEFLQQHPGLKSN